MRLQASFILLYTSCVVSVNSTESLIFRRTGLDGQRASNQSSSFSPGFDYFRSEFDDVTLDKEAASPAPKRSRVESVDDSVKENKPDAEAASRKTKCAKALQGTLWEPELLISGKLPASEEAQSRTIPSVLIRKPLQDINSLPPTHLIFSESLAAIASSTPTDANPAIKETVIALASANTPLDKLLLLVHSDVLAEYTHDFRSSYPKTQKPIARGFSALHRAGRDLDACTPSVARDELIEDILLHLNDLPAMFSVSDSEKAVGEALKFDQYATDFEETARVILMEQYGFPKWLAVAAVPVEALALTYQLSHRRELYKLMDIIMNQLGSATNAVISAGRDPKLADQSEALRILAHNVIPMIEDLRELADEFPDGVIRQLALLAKETCMLAFEIFRTTGQGALVKRALKDSFKSESFIRRI